MAARKGGSAAALPTQVEARSHLLAIAHLLLVDIQLDGPMIWQGQLLPNADSRLMGFMHLLLSTPVLKV
eukprot:6579306-Pyramimonas_sp.AAC.1